MAFLIDFRRNRRDGAVAVDLAEQAVADEDRAIAAGEDAERFGEAGVGQQAVIGALDARGAGVGGDRAGEADLTDDVVKRVGDEQSLVEGAVGDALGRVETCACTAAVLEARCVGLAGEGGDDACRGDLALPRSTT
jgi:hypothetical protein